MKIILNIKWLSIAIFMLNLQSAIINPHSSNLYAQDPQLFEHTWYFVNGEFDGEEFLPVNNLQGELSFTIDFFEVNHTFCQEDGFSSIEYGEPNFFFNLGEFLVVLVGICGEPEQTDFMHKHYSIYGDYQDTGEANNPFNYTIESINDFLQLTITNGEGDWAVYNSVLLSTPTFDQKSFMMHPNPVKENLNIQTNSNQSVSATIYDVSGKLIHKQFLEENNSSINVKALNTGLYFVVFENERGERVSKKFVKN